MKCRCAFVAFVFFYYLLVGFTNCVSFLRSPKFLLLQQNGMVISFFKNVTSIKTLKLVISVIVVVSCNISVHFSFSFNASPLQAMSVMFV